ncbi:FAD-dependent monooxygenase [Streptomyces sp. NBC_01754]|uniref:FAD-dependent monooxygenase n=1 Tax=Streptomyces sp. NBC_01754 TaxID=2975930 RepID=UPI002DD7E7C2|nr:FAD-dependent monooxygenase [Streptomyces sp. NBC_01754]WSC91224.1 FAD-dependent monooxygenase [Streptomyces sp. NBC_01754]
MRTQVIVAGAGPTGLMLAYELTLAGVSVVVLEKQRERGVQSRAGALQPRTAEVLDLRGILAPLLDGAQPHDPAGGHFAMLPVELDCRPWRTRHPYPVTLPQVRLEAYLEELLVSRSVPVLRGHEVSEVEQDEDGVRAGGVHGSYLVACDGARSTVRSLLGAPFPGRPGRMSAVAADLTLASRSEAVPATRGHFSRYPRSAGGFFTILHPLDDGLYRMIFGKLSGNGPGREEPVTTDEVAEALRAVYGPETELGELRAASRFSDAVRQVERYRENRVFFAGDAAHIHMPIGGQGVNLGVQDAVNLGWKLAAAVHGWAPTGLLDSYHDERHPVAAHVLRHTQAQSLIMNPGGDEDAGAVRDLMTELLRLPDANRYVSGMMSGLDLHYPGVGPRLIDHLLTTEEGSTRASDLMHTGQGLLLSLDGEERPLGAHYSGRVRHVVAGTDEDTQGADALLVRPDGYVAWSSTNAEPLESALTRWFG